MPARNSGLTLSKAIRSVLSQTEPDWELLIGVGPSADGTANIADKIAASDRRICSFRNSATTAAAARNQLLCQAEAAHLLFLDADDTIDADHLRKLFTFAASGVAGIFITGFRRVLPDGSTLTERGFDPASDCPITFQRGMPTALHAILFPKQAVLQCDGFDEQLKTNEDWDLCWRLEKAGIQISPAAGVSANYWVTNGSLTSDAAQLHQDRLTVMARISEAGIGTEPAKGELAKQSVLTALWSGARMVAEGGDPACLLDAIVRFEAPVTDQSDGAAALLEGLAIGLAVHFDQIAKHYEPLHRRLSIFLLALEEACGDPGLSVALLNELHRELARLENRLTPFRLGSTKIVPASPFSAGVRSDPSAERIVIRVPFARPRSKFTFSFDAELATGRPPLDLAIRRFVHGRKQKTKDGAQIPVLMYHGVADDGPDELAAWRLSTENFREQMRLLRHGGFRSFDPADWQFEAKMPDDGGRPIVLTFDDGLANFASNALPILQEFGFSAHIFVVAGKIGTSASWDEAYGPPSRLMSEADLRLVVEAGTSVGSHMWSHTNLFRLTGKQIREEAYRSAATLGDLTGRRIQSVAPPYGAFDPAIADILEECGYEQIFGIRHDFSPIKPSFRDIARLEIDGQMSPDQFADLLGIEVAN